jgi:hypothetical protein
VVVVVLTTTISPRCSAARYHTPRNPDRPTFGPWVEEWARRLTNGRGLMPWQSDAVAVSCELDTAAGTMAYPFVVWVVPRRAGKTLATLAVAAQRAAAAPLMRCWYTAHKREAAATVFRDEWVPMLDRLAARDVVKVRRSQGSEGFTVARTGGKVQLFPPTANALHAQNCDLAIIDEAWSFDLTTGEAVEAGVRPAQLTRPLRQTWIVSAGGTPESTYLDRWITLGRDGAPGVCYIEWSADPDAPGYDPYDPDVIRAAHPAVGYTVDVAAILADAATMDRAGFERAYLNVWPRPSGAGGGLGAAWPACAAPDLAPRDPIAFGVEVDPDRTVAVIAAAGLDRGRLVVEVVDRRPGTDWVAARVAQLDADHRPVAVGLDPAGPAGALLPYLAAAGVTTPTVRLCDARDYAQACGALFDDVTAGRLAHRAQVDLDVAVGGVVRRPVAGAWGWARTTGTTPLGAVTLAAWAWRASGGLISGPNVH